MSFGIYIYSRSLLFWSLNLKLLFVVNLNGFIFPCSSLLVTLSILTRIEVSKSRRELSLSTKVGRILWAKKLCSKMQMARIHWKSTCYVNQDKNTKDMTSMTLNVTCESKRPRNQRSKISAICSGLCIM